jgi:hypothetical protein
MDPNEKSFELASIYYPVYHSSANGIPLRAQTNEKMQKPLFLDSMFLFRKKNLIMGFALMLIHLLVVKFLYPCSMPLENLGYFPCPCIW